jgi:hypothetical protein
MVFPIKNRTSQEDFSFQIVSSLSCLRKLAIQFTFLWLLIIFPLASLFSQSPPPPFKKIYLESLYESNGVTIDQKNRVRNQISLNIYKHFKNSHTFIDDVIINGYLNQLKKQQQIGCDTDKCYKMIEDSLNPDQKISGSLAFLNGRYTLTLRLIDLANSKGLLDVKEVSYSPRQMEYFVEELTKTLLDPTYKPRYQEAPPEFIEEKIDFGSIRIQSLDGIDIKIFEFKTNDTKSDFILASLKPRLEEGDSLFKEKKFKQAGEIYQSIIEVIQSSLTLETRKLISVYEEGIVSRRNQSFYNILQSEITAIDTAFSNSSKDTPKLLKDTILKYESILTKINRLSPDKQKEITLALNKRIEALDLKYYDFQEKKADKMYDNFTFTEAHREYRDIFSALKNKEGEGYLLYKNKIEKKILATQSTGKSFVTSRVKAYCDLAEREYLVYSLEKNQFSFFNKIQAENKIEEYLEEAERILKKSDFASRETIDSYNRLVSLINEKRDRESRLGRFFHRDDAFSIESFNQIRRDKSYFFPGRGHIYVDPGEYKSKFLYYGGWAAFWYTLYAGNKTYVNFNRYISFERTSSSYYTDLDASSVHLIYLNDSLRQNFLHNKYSLSNQEFNTSIGIFSLFYFVSLIDAFTYSDSNSSMGWKDPNTLPLIKLDTGVIQVRAGTQIPNSLLFPRSLPEIQTNLEYIVEF